MRAIKKIKQGQGLENAWASMVFYIGKPREDLLFKVAYKPRSWLKWWTSQVDFWGVVSTYVGARASFLWQVRKRESSKCLSFGVCVCNGEDQILLTTRLYFYFEEYGKPLECFEQRSNTTQVLPNHSNYNGENKLREQGSTVGDQ